MDASVLAALGGLLTIIGGGIAWIVAQVRTVRRERHEDALAAQKLRAEIYLDEIEKARTETATRDLAIQGLRAALGQVNSDRLSYYRQLIDHQITPDPTYREVPHV